MLVILNSLIVISNVVKNLKAVAKTDASCLSMTKIIFIIVSQILVILNSVKNLKALAKKDASYLSMTEIG